MRYLLGGYYGMRNAGDDALLYVVLSQVSRLDAAASFKVIAPVAPTTPPGVAVAMHKDGAPLQTLRALWGSDVWLFGGGGLLQDSSLHSVPTLRTYLRQARLARGFGCRVAMLGVGVGPLRTQEGRQAALGLLRCADLVTVRDEESRSTAQVLGWKGDAIVTGDLGFLLEQSAAQPFAQRTGSDGQLGVSLLSYSRSVGGSAEADKDAVRHMAGALGDVMAHRRDLRVTLFEFFAGSRRYGDATALRALQRQLRFPDRVSYRAYDGDPVALHAEIRRCRAVVGMRFHSCVYAYGAEVPCLMIAYHPKSLSLARSLALSPETAVLPLHLATKGELRPRIERLLDEPEAFRPAIPIDTHREGAAENFRLFADWLIDSGWIRSATSLKGANAVPCSEAKGGN